MQSRFTSVWALATSSHVKLDANGQDYITAYTQQLNKNFREKFKDEGQQFYHKFINNATVVGPHDYPKYADLIDSVTGPYAYTYQKWVNQTPHDFPDIPHKAGGLRRDKRQIGMAIAFATSTITGLLGLGSNLYSMRQIETLTTQLLKQQDNQDILSHQIQLNDERLRVAEAKLSTVFDSLNNTLSALSSLNAITRFSSFYNGAMQYLQDIKLALLGMELGLNALMNKKLSPSMISLANLTSAFQIAKQRALEENLLLLNSQDPAYLLSADVSSVSVDGRPFIILHVPLKSQSRHFKVYELSNKPILYEGLIFRITLEENILVINSDHTLFRTMTRSELARCRKYDNTYHCNSPNIFKRDFSKHCLSRLFLQKLDKIHEYCPMTVNDDTESVEQIRPDLFRIISTKPISADITCKDNTHKHYQISGVKTVSVPGYCNGLTPNHVFMSRHDYSILLNATVKVHISATELFDILDMSSPDLEALRTLIKDQRSYHPFQQVDLYTFRNLYQQHTGSISATAYTYKAEILISCLLALIIGMALLVYAIRRCAPRIRARHRQADNDLTHTEAAELLDRQNHPQQQRNEQRPNQPANLPYIEN